jgi:glucosamine-6-phosphate deaminase
MKKTINGIEIQIVQGFVELSQVAAERIKQRIMQSDKTSLLVPTGTTPEGTYGLLAKESPELFRNVSFYNMDEYCARSDDDSYAFLPIDDERSYHYYMKRHILDASPFITSFFPGIENIKQPGSYDKLIESHGGIDLCLNAIGEDGHTFGFNLPGSSFSSETHLVKINENTKEVNEKLTGLETPQYAVSVGLMSGMSANEVLLLVSGKRKAEILKRILLGNISEDIPATILRNHKNCTWIVDEDAASKL